MIVNLTTCPVPKFFPSTYSVTIIWNEEGSGADVHNEFGRYIIRLPKKDLFINIGLRQEIVDKYYDKVLLPFSLIHELLHIYYKSDEFSFEGIVGDNDLSLYREAFNFLEDRRIEQTAMREINGIGKYVIVANAITALREVNKGIPPHVAFLLEQSFKWDQNTRDHRKADTRNIFRFASNAVNASGLTYMVNGVRNILAEFYHELEEKNQEVKLRVNLNLPGDSPDIGANGSSSGGGKGDQEDQGSGNSKVGGSGGSSPAKKGGGAGGNGKPPFTIDLELVPRSPGTAPKVIVPDNVKDALEKGVVEAIKDFLKGNTLYDNNPVITAGGGYSPGTRKEVPRTLGDALFLAKVRVEQAPLIDYLKEKYLEQKIRYSTIYRANDGDYNPERIEELEKMLLLRDDLATPYETPGANKYSRTDLCIVLDQSGSTIVDKAYEEMATMAAVFLLAFEDFEEMRTCLISLKGDVSVCKFFDEPVEATVLMPTASGGTPIDPALRMALKQEWESDLRFLVLISDGIFGENELGSMPDLKNKGINTVAMTSDEPIPLFDFHLFMKDKAELPEKLASFILPQMIDGYAQEL